MSTLSLIPFTHTELLNIVLDTLHWVKVFTNTRKYVWEDSDDYELQRRYELEREWFEKDPNP